MSGHNPHGRLGQPAAWNPLQVPSFLPRQPQLAHMSNERSMLGAPPLGWPPLHPAETLYGYMAAAAAASAASAASSANHKAPQLDFIPLLPALARQANNLPFGSVDLSSTSRNSLTPSPRGRLPSPVTTSTPVSGKHNDSGVRNKNNKSPSPSESMPLGQNEHMANMGNGSILPAALLSMLAARSQAAAAASNSPPPSNTAVDQLNNKHNTTSGGGIFVRDASQINNDISKLASVVAAANGDNQGPKEFSDPMELIRRMSYLKQAMEAPLGAAHEGSIAPPPPMHPFQSVAPQPNVPQHITELSKSLLSMFSNGGLAPGLQPQLNLQPPPAPLKSPSYGNGTQPQRKSPRKNNHNHSMTTSTDDSHDDASMCNGIGSDQRRSRYRRRKPKKTQRLSNENSLTSPNGSDNMDIDDSIVKSLDESEIETNNARRTAEQIANLMSAAAAAATAAKKPYSDINNMSGIFSNDQLAEANGLNFEDMIPLSKTKIPQLRANNGDNDNINGIELNNFNKKKMDIGSADGLLNMSNTLDYTKDHLDKRQDRSVDDCDIDKIAEIVAKTVSASENMPFMHMPASHKNLSTGLSPAGGDSNGMRHEPNRYDEDKPHLPQAQAKIPSTSSPISGSGNDLKSTYNEIETMLAGVDKEYRSFENELSVSKVEVMDAESVNNSQASNSKQTERGEVSDEKTDGQSGNENGQGNGTSKKDSDASASTAGAAANKNGKRSKSTKKPIKKNKKKGGNKNNKGGKNAKNQPAKCEKKAKAKEESAAAEALSKFRGPYVQIGRDGSETVINAPITEEIADKQAKLKKNFVGHSMNDRNKIRGLHVSTLSNKYDTATTDKSWMCVFCKLGPHKYSLGDLFGPYILSTTDEDFQLSQIDPADDLFRSQRTKLTMLQSRGMSFAMARQIANAMTNGEASPKASTSGKGRKRKITEVEAGAGSPVPTSKDAPDIFYGMTKVAEDSYEVWVHEDCIVWSSGVHVVGIRIVGLDAAVWGSSRHQCVECAQYGAILSCLHRGCTDVAHYPCAKRSGWDLDENEFKSRCSKHSSDVNSAK